LVGPEQKRFINETHRKRATRKRRRWFRKRDDVQSEPEVASDDVAPKQVVDPDDVVFEVGGPVAADPYEDDRGWKEWYGR
jgi:hypothetical protein